MRGKADARIGFALGAIVLLALLFSLGRDADSLQEPELTPLRSTYRARPSGLKALYLTLEKLGYRPRRLLLPPDELKEDGTLVIAEPTSTVTDAEWRAVGRWVARGNLLIFVAQNAPEPSRVRQPGLPVTESPMGATPVQPVPVAIGAASPVIASPHRIRKTEWTRFGAEKTTVVAPGAVPLVPLFAEGGRTVLAYARWGKGIVVVSCSPWSLSNVGIGRGSNLALFLNLVDVYGAGKRRPIFFDEYHLGSGAARGPMSLLAPVARRGVWQIVVALLLLVFAVSRRFGAMIPDEVLERRTRTEYLTAMTSLFRRARALELAAAKLRDETRRDLARALGLPPDAKPEMIARAANEKRGVDADRVRRVLEEVDHLAVARARQIPIDAGRVLAAASKLYAVREEITRGRHA